MQVGERGGGEMERGERNANGRELGACGGWIGTGLEKLGKERERERGREGEKRRREERRGGKEGRRGEERLAWGKWGLERRRESGARGRGDEGWKWWIGGKGGGAGLLGVRF